MSGALKICNTSWYDGPWALSLEGHLKRQVKRGGGGVSEFERCSDTVGFLVPKLLFVNKMVLDTTPIFFYMSVPSVEDF